MPGSNMTVDQYDNCCKWLLYLSFEVHYIFLYLAGNKDVVTNFTIQKQIGLFVDKIGFL